MAGLLGLLSDAAELTSKTAKVAPKVAKAGEVMSIPAEIAAQFVKAADPAHIRGAEIMDMLKSGRGSEVTDQMLDMGDPVLNARLNEYLYKNADIPMDAASRMARASDMGFDTNTLMYHGTDSPDIVSFNPFIGSKRMPATFLSDSKTVAGTYGDNVGQYFVRSDNPAEFNFDGRSSTYFNNESVTPSSLVYRVKEATDNAAKYGSETDSDLAFDLQSAGVDPMYADMIDAVKMNNVVDSFGFGGSPANNLAVFDPVNIRKRSARFDPRLSHLKNLSASVGAGLLGANMMPNNDGSR